jgi:spermidine synthase
MMQITNGERKRDSKALILFTYFALGAFALISQTMMLREFFVVVYGNEFIFGVLLTNWLIGIFGGALIGGALSERSKNNLMLFVVSILAMSILLPISITLIRFLYRISQTPPGTYIGFFKVFWYSAAVIIPVSFFIGFVFPIAARVQLNPADNKAGHSKQKTVKGISDIYIFEALGSLLSGIVYTFLLAGRLNAYFIAALAMLPLVVSSCLLLKRAGYRKTLAVSLLILALTLSLSFPGVNGKLETLTVKMRWQSVSTLPLNYSTDSRYQNIAVAKLLNQYNLYLNTMFASVFPNDEDNMLLAAHLACQHPGPRRILVIGDAVSGLAKFLLHFDVKEVISVEIDAKTVDTILRFLPPRDKQILQDPRFKIIIKDGRQYVKDLARSNGEKPPASDRTFDLVYLNVSEPSTLLLNRYYTAEFFHDLRGVMSPGGVVALKITSSENYGQGLVTDYTASLYNTVKSVFPEMVVTPGHDNFIFASGQKDVVTDSPQILARRYEATGVQPRKLGLIFRSFYPEEKTRFIKNALLHHDKSSINTDETPIASLYFNKIVGWYGESNVAGLLEFFENVKLRDVTLLVLALFLLRLLYVSLVIHKTPSRSSRIFKFHVLFAVFAGGLAGLSLELVILYTFQSNYGDIYHIIGFIIALFMFGLPLGALTSNRLMKLPFFSNQNQLVILVSFIQAATAGLAFLLPHITTLFGPMVLVNQIAIFLETMVIGFLIGLVFPLAVHLYMGAEGKAGKTAGIVDGFDHFGAAVGAFFIGTLFLPVIGVEKVCRLVALFPLIAAVLLFIDTGRQRGSSDINASGEKATNH